MSLWTHWFIPIWLVIFLIISRLYTSLSPDCWSMVFSLCSGKQRCGKPSICRLLSYGKPVVFHTFWSMFTRGYIPKLWWFKNIGFPSVSWNGIPCHHIVIRSAPLQHIPWNPFEIEMVGKVPNKFNDDQVDYKIWSCEIPGNRAIGMVCENLCETNSRTFVS